MNYEATAAMNCADALASGIHLAEREGDDQAAERLKFVLDALLQPYPNAVEAMLERNTACARSDRSIAALKAHVDSNFDDFTRGLPGRKSAEDINDYMHEYIFRGDWHGGLDASEICAMTTMLCAKAIQRQRQ